MQRISDTSVLGNQHSAGFKFIPRRYLLTRPVPLAQAAQLLAFLFVAPTHHTLPQMFVFGASQLSPRWASGTRCEAFPPAPQFTPPDGLAQSFGAEERFALLPILTPSLPLAGVGSVMLISDGSESFCLLRRIYC